MECVIADEPFESVIVEISSPSLEELESEEVKVEEILWDR